MEWTIPGFILYNFLLGQKANKIDVALFSESEGNIFLLPCYYPMKVKEFPQV